MIKRFFVNFLFRAYSLLAPMSRKQSTSLDWHLGSTLQLFVSLSLEGNSSVIIKASESTKKAFNCFRLHYSACLVSKLNPCYLVPVASVCR